MPRPLSPCGPLLGGASGARHGWLRARHTTSQTIQLSEWRLLLREVITSVAGALHLATHSMLRCPCTKLRDVPG